MKPVPARPCGFTFHGRRYLRCTVGVIIEKLVGARLVRHEWAVPVIAESPAAAIRLVQGEVLDKLTRNPVAAEPVNFVSWGVRGGEVRRFSGWNTLFGHAVFARDRDVQLALPIQ